MTKRWTLFGLGLGLALMAPLNLLAQDEKKADAPAAAVAPADPAVLLKAIPADAAAFVALNSLKQLDQDIQDAAKAVNLPPNTIPSIVPLFKDSLKLGKGFNENGSMAIVLLDISKVTKPEELEGRVLIYIPATDAKGLSEAMGAEAAGDMLKLDLAGDQAFGVVRGDYLVVAKKEEAIKALGEAKGGEGLAKAVPSERQKAYATQDVYGWVNLSAIPKELVNGVAEQFEQQVSGTPMAGMLGSIEQLKSFFEQGQELAFGLSLDPKKGISGHFRVAMKPDTDLGKQMAAMKGVSGSLLAGLPGDPFVAALGAVCSPDTEKQMKKALDLVLSEETVGDSVDKEKLGQIRDGLVKLLGSVQQLGLAVYGTKSEEESGMINAALVAQVKDSAQWKQDAKKLFTLAKDVIGEVAKKGGDEEKAKQALDALQWKDAAEKSGDAEVDVLSLDLSKLPDVQAEEIDQVKKVIGKEGVTIRIGSIGKDKIAIVFGGGAKRFEAIAKLAGGSDSPLADNKSIKVVADRLSTGPKLAEGYLNLDNLLDLVMEIAQELGGGIPFPIKLQNAAPITMVSVKEGDTAQKTEVLIPMELIKAGVDAARPFLMGIGGGAGGNEPTPPADSSELK